MASGNAFRLFAPSIFRGQLFLLKRETEISASAGNGVFCSFLSAVVKTKQHFWLKTCLTSDAQKHNSLGSNLYLFMARQISSENSYRDVLVKLIPSETIAAFVAIQSMLSGTKETNPWIIWGVPALLLASIPFNLRIFYKVLNTFQIICTMGSFVVWAYSLGGIQHESSKYGGVALVLWTSIIPFFLVRKTEFCRGDFVQIIAKKPAASVINRPTCIIEWNVNMTEFCSKETQIVSVNGVEKWVKLDIDEKRNDWAFEWITIVKN